jgi:uncharacterized protein (TIGR01777 family)
MAVMRVLVTGGTGFVGGSLCQVLRGQGHAVTVVSRTPAQAGGSAVSWEQLDDAVAASDAVVHLAGEPIAARRWTAAQKLRIAGSREGWTRTLVDAIERAPRRPRVLVSASAIGYYGARGDEPLDETSPPGTGFLADVCQAWEREAARAETLGVRVVRLRVGIVLATGGGALARMVPPFRLFLGGRLGSGKQWMSWIHRDDLIGLIVEALRDPNWRGAVNATAPHPVTNAEFTQTLAEALMRPAWLPVPALALRLALGEMATMLLTGQRVLPKVAGFHSYRWRFPDLPQALRATVRR